MDGVEKLRTAALELSQETKIWLPSWFVPTAIPSYSRIELTMGDASLDLAGEEVTELWQALLRRAEA